MFTRGYAKPPCTHLSHSQGFAVGRVERYPCIVCDQGRGDPGRFTVHTADTWPELLFRRVFVAHSDSSSPEKREEV